MARTPIESGEAAFFRSLNQIVEPIAKGGWLSPGLLPTGLIALEVEGRISGTLHTVPLVATRIAGVLLVATVRPRSEWVRNLGARPLVRYWIDGTARSGQAAVIAPGVALVEPEGAPPYIGLLASQLRPWTKVGWSFAIIVPAGGDAGREP